MLTAALFLSVPLSASELSLTEVRDKVPPLRRLDPGLMPLPDTAGGLEWSSLVSAAKAYEGKAALQVAAALKPAKKVLRSGIQRDFVLPPQHKEPFPSSR